MHSHCEIVSGFIVMTSQLHEVSEIRMCRSHFLSKG